MSDPTKTAQVPAIEPAAEPADPLSMNLTGQTLAGRYRIEGRLGEGGMAYVYLARDLESGGEVAIKVLLPQLTGEPAAVERLRREAVIAMRLGHPNVCPILSVGETPELPIYLVMPYLAGEPLALREARQGPLSVDEGIPLLRQICRGLEHAHGLQILHRDLKPENVMQVPDPDVAGGVRAVLMDFGLAKVLRDEPGLVKLTRTGLTLGTPEFMSPEQVFGKPLDGRSDQYALGVLAFEMFTGRVPFEGKSPQEIALARLKGEPLRLRALRPDLPAKLETVIGRALARDPADRFQSMEELSAAFASVTAKTGVEGSSARAVADLADGFILASVQVAAPPTRVFQALASTEVCQWWVRPGVFDTSEWTGEVRVGRRWRASGLARGRPYTLEGEFREVDPPRKLVHTWQGAGTPGTPTVVTYLLEPVDGGTRITLRHSGFVAREVCTNTCIGWETSLGRLAEVLD